MKHLAAISGMLAFASACFGQTLGDALNPALSWTTGGAVPWEVTTNATHDGVATAQSGLLSVNGQDSWIQTTVIGPAAVDFWWRVTTESSQTLIQLYIGGALQTQRSAYNTPWQRDSYYVPSGAQVVRWRFVQNVSSSAEQRAWLDEVSLSSPVAATITADPTNQTVMAGDTATLMAAGSGTEPLLFQWLKSGVPVASATSSVLTIANAQTGNAGDYSLMLMNPLSTVTSQVATLTVSASAPVFTLQPVSQGAPPLTTASFTAAAKGTMPITWQWYSNNVSLRGQTSSSYSIPSVRSNYYADYFVVVANSEGSTTSVIARLNYSPLVVWGDNTYGQRVVPSAATNVIDVCGGDYHCLALCEDGNVLGWGANTWSGLPFNQASVPPRATNAIAIAAGSAHSLAALDDGTVLKWGQIVFSEWQDVPSEATNVIAPAQGTGAQHAVALRADGTVIGWGTTNHNLQPIPPGVSNIVAVAVGAYHSIALTADGRVLSWGGDPSWEYPQIVPQDVSNVVAIATGWFHNLALRADGTLVSWGRGYGSSTAVTNVPSAATNIIAIACGASFSYALRRDGTFVAWGASIPAAPYWATNVSLIAGARVNSLAILADGPPRFCGPLVDRSVTSGGNCFFYARAVGATPLSWQWQFNGTAIAGATNPWLAVPNVQTPSSGLYAVVVSNALGVVTNSGARLNVLPDLRISLSGALQPSGAFLLSATGQTGLVWTVETSSNFSNWTGLTTLTNSTGSMSFDDTETNHAWRFYRLRLGQ